jgi:hypothetical protein
LGGILCGLRNDQFFHAVSEYPFGKRLKYIIILSQIGKKVNPQQHEKPFFLLISFSFFENLLAFSLKI